MDLKSINELLSNKSIIGEGATSFAYRVDNCYLHKRFLCLKILKNAVIMKDSSIQKSKSHKKEEEEAFWDEEDSNERKEEKELNFDMIKELCLEFETLNKLNHPNIVKAYAFYFGDEKTNPAILLEYCKYDLTKVINRLHDYQLVGVIYEICSAMKHVHACKIIHRDLKMANILINLKKHVKICDFGIAREMDLETYTTLTKGVGTLAFMAPELFSEDSKYDEKVDLYSFGVVMYYIVTKGQMPKFNPKVGYESIKMPSIINKLSQSIIKRCWSKDPSKRPSFEEIIELIVRNNFMLIDGIEDDIPQLKQHLGLK